MNSENSDQISHGTPDMCREVIHEVAGMVSLQAELAMRYAELGDDTGLEYAVRRWTAYTRSAIATMADLKALKAHKGGHEHGPR